MTVNTCLTDLRARTTLGTWVADLCPGSSCFSCGGKLQAGVPCDDLQRSTDRRLYCPSCGAEVGQSEPVQVGSPADDEPQIPVAA